MSWKERDASLNLADVIDDLCHSAILLIDTRPGDAAELVEIAKRVKVIRDGLPGTRRKVALS